VDWIAANADAWIMYPRNPQMQARVLAAWRTAVQDAGFGWKPFAQSLFIDLTEDPDTPPSPIHLGFRLGRRALIELLELLHEMGVNHVIFNLKHSRRAAAEVVDELGREIVPLFPALPAGAVSAGAPAR
jgi:hypothetical protein